MPLEQHDRESLHDEVAELFASLNGYERAIDDLNWFASNRAARQKDANQRWKFNHPERHRAGERRRKKRHAKTAKGRASNGRYRDKNRERLRASWRKSSAKYRARKVAP